MSYYEIDRAELETSVDTVISAFTLRYDSLAHRNRSLTRSPYNAAGSWIRLALLKATTACDTLCPLLSYGCPI